MEDVAAPYTSEEIIAKKREFAAAFLQFPNDPSRAASMIEARVAHKSYIVLYWPHDAEVQVFMNEIMKSKGAVASVPEDKYQFARQIYLDALECKDKDTKLDYFKLFADVMGYIEKNKGTTINNNNNMIDNRSIMLMPDDMPLDEWEEMAMKQQQKMLEDVANSD